MGITAAIAALSVISLCAWAHPTPRERTPASSASAAVAPAPHAAPMPHTVGGQGDLRFHVLYTREHLPPEAVAVLEQAHGGFAVDRRLRHPGTGGRAMSGNGPWRNGCLPRAYL